MPIYEYECEQCGQVEEILQKFSDRPLAVCKNCSGKLHRLISQSAFHLKGSGWYVTDYASKKKKGADNVDSTPKPSDSSKADTKSSGTE